ncbi:hypothetical protein AB5J52_46420 [Streptomyces sp. R39]|uniref:Uncharacterized protein n=1 Tax=Streptomyces sp. R39 TaxID=3238631 RepID=A0AB39R460_9ACTN
MNLRTVAEHEVFLPIAAPGGESGHAGGRPPRERVTALQSHRRIQ